MENAVFRFSSGWQKFFDGSIAIPAGLWCGKFRNYQRW